MREIPITSTNHDLKKIIREWVDLLAEGRFDEAVRMLSPEVLPANGSVNEEEYPQWTGELVEKVIAHYGLPFPFEGQEQTYKVVPVEDEFRDLFEEFLTVDGEPFALFGQSYRYHIQVALPLDYAEGNDVGDLTARIYVREIGGGKMVLVLGDIHML